jgi:hypothetical protein
MIKCEDAIWLYGSRARGDVRPDSDVDVLLIGDGDSGEIAAYMHEPSNGLSISQYSWQEIESMKAYGSLFLLHLKNEGKMVAEGCQVEGRLESLLSGIPKYSRAATDIANFREALSDIVDSIQFGNFVEFELGNLATIARHVAILGCALMGDPKFDRVGPIRAISKVLDLDPTLSNSFEELYKFRMFCDHRCNSVVVPDARVIAEWIRSVDVLLGKLEEEINARRY